MTEQARETVFSIIERWGFPTLVALAAGYVLRNDVLLPLVSEHRTFVQELSETQREITKAQGEISRAVQEQTRLLYTVQPKGVQPIHDR